jgi:hypothetical protein
MRGAGGRAAAELGAGVARVCAGFEAVPAFGVGVTVVETEVGGATVAAAEVGGLGGGTGEGVEAEVVEAAAATRTPASGCSGGGASMLFDELSRPSIWETNLYCLRHKFRKV